MLATLDPASRRLFVHVRGATRASTAFAVRVHDTVASLATDWFRLRDRTAVMCCHCLALPQPPPHPTLFDLDRLAQLVAGGETLVACFADTQRAHALPTTDVTGAAMRTKALAIAVNRASEAAGVRVRNSTSFRSDNAAASTSGRARAITTGAQEVPARVLDDNASGGGGGANPLAFWQNDFDVADVVDARDFTDAQRVASSVSDGIAVRLDELVPGLTMAEVLQKKKKATTTKLSNG